MKYFTLGLMMICVTLVYPSHTPAQNDNENIVKVLDLVNDPATELPATFQHILPSKERSYTNFSIENNESGPYLRALSSGTSSWLEMDLGDISLTEYSIMEWQWLVNQFPKTDWEEKKSNDDYAIRIELVYDLKGSKWNILNIIRKGLLKSLFGKYPPELVVSYVWSLNVPVDISFVSPNAKNTIIIPVESGKAMMGRWVSERRNIQEDFEKLWQGSETLYLKKIRIKADTESLPSVAESGLKYLRLTTDSGE